MSCKQELRAKNLETILKFFSPKTRQPGGAKLRAELFGEHSLKQVCYPISGAYGTEPPYVWAKDFLMSQPDVGVGLDLDAIVYVTEDPEYIIAETIEKGKIDLCGAKRDFRGQTFHFFRVEDGVIDSWRNFSNIYNLYDALGIETVKITRPIFSEERIETWRRELDSFRVMDEVAPVVEDGTVTRIKVYDQYDDSPEAEYLRARNKAAVIERAASKAYADGGHKFCKEQFNPDGYTLIPFPHQDPTSYPNIFHEHTMTPVHPPLSKAPWKEEIVRIYPTGDPNYFWTEQKHHTRDFVIDVNGDYKPCRYWNHYLFTYQFRDGKLDLRREIYDPSHERFLKGANDPQLPQEAIDFLRYL